MKEEEKVLEAVKKLDREDFENLSLTCLEKLGIGISNFKAMEDCILAKGTVQTKEDTEEYIIKFTRSAEKSSLEYLKNSLSSSTEGLFVTPEKIEDKFRSNGKAEIVGGEKLYRLLDKFNLISRFDLIKDEDPSEALREKGELYLTQEKYEKAIDLLERAVDIDESLSESWQFLGKAYYHNGQKKEALRAYETASDLQLDNIVILKRKGRILYELNRYDEAILCFEKILDQGAGTKEVWNNKALCHLRNSEYEESLDSIETALSIDPEFEEALLNKALIFEKLGKIKKALEAIEELLELVPNKVDYYYAKAAYLISLERFEEGRKSINEALKLEPDHEGANRLQSRLEKGSQG